MTARAVLQQADISRALTRIAHEILESNRGPEGLVVLGIPTRGVELADRVAGLLTEFAGVPAWSCPVGSLDVTMYRDDLGRNPVRGTAPTRIPDAGIDGATVVLVDDVLYSGRTIRAALDALADIGRPAAVRLAVLVDRGHRQLPIRPDFVGKNLPSAASERVNVRLAGTDGVEAVTIEGGTADEADAVSTGGPAEGGAA
ncbi:MAG: bifunctional pyr operon transcriptional regulator/uracil phosphoribosyltransferase [Naasia sp.]|nr:bifunctional pyr operon transcriptional regulator/uracil phosphoribosyltransferase [Naasia sp.]